MGVILAFCATLLWSLSDVITKISLEKESVWKVLFIGRFVGGFTFLIVAFTFVDFSALLTWNFLIIGLLALVNLVGMYTFYKSVQTKGISLSMPIIYSWVFVTALLSYIFYNEKLSASQWIAIITIVIGVAIITIKSTKRFKFDKSFIFAFLALLTWGTFYFILKIPNAIFGALLVTGCVNFLTSLTAIPILMVKKINIFKIKNKILVLVILIGLLDTFGFLLFNYAIESIPVSIGSAVAATAPVFVVLAGVYLLKETITKKQILGIIIAIIGLFIISF